MKCKPLLGGLLLAGVLCFPAYGANSADNAPDGGTGNSMPSGFLGEIQSGSMSQSTATFIGDFIAGLNPFPPDAAQNPETAFSAPMSPKIRITAYSSTPDQTDDTPFTTALGTKVRDGIIATNFLPFGTKVRISSLFGDKIFTVEDRMNPRYGHSVDIWMPSTSQALRFGVQFTEIEIIPPEHIQDLALSL